MHVKERDFSCNVAAPGIAVAQSPLLCSQKIMCSQTDVVSERKQDAIYICEKCNQLQTVLSRIPTCMT